MHATFKFSNGKEYKIGSRYAVGLTFIRPLYLKYSCVIEDEAGKVEVPFSDYCEGCDQEFVNTPGKRRFLCRDLDINKRYGHVLKICSLCYWYLEDQKGGAIPKKIKEQINDGFVPERLL